MLVPAGRPDEVMAIMPEAHPPQGDTVESLVARFLVTVPETWTDHDPATLSELQERAVYLLTAAGMIERRVTLRLRIVRHPVAVEATITMTGEAGLAQAMEFVLKDIWNDWREAFEHLGDEPVSHCERIGNEQWRLTAEGVIARNDLDAGNAATVFDFVLRRGFFDGQPRLLPGGRISQRLPVGGRGALERMRRVSSDAGPPSMAIANWDAGAEAFAKVLAELQKKMQSAEEHVPVPNPDNALAALLRVFTNGVADERLRQAAPVLADVSLTANERLTKIDGLMPLQRDPPQTVGFLHEIERAGYCLLRSINYEGEVAPVEADTILAQPQEHWTLWLQR
ncbi:MAG: hypothetical protein ACK4RK_16075 [Gemmataceae bacterium]